jgi:hypothetical protein
VRFFLTSADASFCSSQSGFFQDQNCLNYGSLSDLEVLFLNPRGSVLFRGRCSDPSLNF